MNLTRALAILTIGVATIATPARLLAQANVIPPEVITSNDISADGKAKIKAAVDAHLQGLTGDAIEIKKSRNALIEPCRNPQVSVPFRLEYTKQLIGALKTNAASANDIVAVNALLLSGEIATAQTVDVLMDGIKDKRPGVRYAATTGFVSTFSAVRQTVPAIGTPAQVLRVLDALKTGMEAESNPQTLEGFVLALQQASRVPTKQIEGVRDGAVRRLSEGVSNRIKSKLTSFASDAAYRRAIQAIRNAVTNPDASEPELDSKDLRTAAGMAGDLLALALQRVKNGQLSAEQRSDLALMVGEAERTIFFIEGKLSQVTPKEHKLEDLVRQSKDAEYQREVLELIGPNGALTGSMFQFPDDRFVSNK